MALSKSTLATAIENDLLSLYTSAEPSPMTKEEFAEEIASLLAERIIDHFVSNAEVSTSVSVASVSGVTPGPGASGPGSGTGTGTLL